MADEVGDSAGRGRKLMEAAAEYQLASVDHGRATARLKRAAAELRSRLINADPEVVRHATEAERRRGSDA